MDHNTDKEKWINEVLGSTRGKALLEPQAGLYERIAGRLNEPGPSKMASIPARQWVAAAVLLLAANVASVIYYTEQNTKTAVTAQANPVAAEIQPIATYNY